MDENATDVADEMSTLLTVGSMFTIVVTKVTGRAGDSLLAGTMFRQVTEVVGRQAALDYFRGYADDPLKSSPAMQSQR